MSKSYEELAREQASAPKDTAPKQSTPRPSIVQIEKRLKELYALPALPLALKCEQCALHYAENAEAAAESLINLAKTNARVRRVLEGLVQAGNTGEVVLTHAMLLTPILLHHNMLPLPPFVVQLFGGAAQEHQHEAPMPEGVMPEDPAAVVIAQESDDTAFSLD